MTSPGSQRPRIGEALLAQGALTKEQLESALKQQKATGRMLGEVLVEQGVINSSTLVQSLARCLGVKGAHLRHGLIDPALMPLLGHEECERLLVIPLFKVRNNLTVAMAEPQSLPTIDRLRQIAGCDIRPVLALEGNIREYVGKYKDGDANVDAFLASLGESDVEVVEREKVDEGPVTDLDKMVAGSPIVNLVNVAMLTAIKDGASDVHLEPERTGTRVRYRVDGVLRDLMRPPAGMHAAIVSRITDISKRDIAEKRLPQEGRIRIVAEGRDIDLRVSSMPTLLGEKLVIRVLDKANLKVRMEDLGFRLETLMALKRILARPYGLVLVTGPTGSGKTSTLYASLNWLKCPTKNIITVEDPIEFQVQGLTQVQIDTKSGTTFAAGLRSILRQDPNIILVGEIRDSETASLALEAAQTGHLLLSTLHTNDSVATITRLLDLGIEPFQVAASVIGILAQRLVRRVCQGCAIDGAPSEDAVEKAGGIERLPVDVNWKVSVGCAACQQTGFKGRMAIHELLEVTEDIRDLIAQRAPDHTIREAARKNGMKGLMEAGLAAAAQGLTTLEEVVRVAPREESLMPDSVPAALNQASSFGWSGKASGGAPAKGIISILLLEDEPDTQALLKLILEKQGYEVVSSPQSETVS